jgi:putative FmdB family regulatory protein
MPTYEYACTECGERLEVVQSFSDDPLTVCPACQGKLRKLFSAVGVVFKGEGRHNVRRDKPADEVGHPDRRRLRDVAGRERARHHVEYGDQDLGFHRRRQQGRLTTGRPPRRSGSRLSS